MADQRPVHHFFSYEYDDGTDRPLLPAEEGAWSLEGLSHAATLTTHFFLEGQVKRRAPYSDKFAVFVGPPRAGSWMADFYLALQEPSTWAGVVAGLSVNVPTIFKVFNRITRRATGQAVDDDASSRFEEQHSGTFDALVEAVEPSIQRAHRVIKSRRTILSINAGKVGFHLNQATKEYIETSNLDHASSRSRGNVASYNVNNRTGRFYFDHLGRTVPFVIHKEADVRTEVALARSLENYAGSRLANSDIEITYRGIRAIDDRIKRIVIFDANFIFIRR
jgi:hypothetical protein